MNQPDNENTSLDNIKISNKNKKPICFILFMSIGSIVVVAFNIVVILFVNFFVIGNPIGAFIARGQIETYVNTHFTDFDFVVGFPRFHISSGGYHYLATVRARDNANINFTVTYSRQFHSGYFRNSYNNVIRYLASSLLEEAFGDSITRLSVSKSSASRTPIYYLDMHLSVDSFEAHALLEKIIETRDIIEQNEIPIRFYSFFFVSEDKKMEIASLQTIRINDELITLIEDVYEAFGSSGERSFAGERPIWYRFEYILN